MKNIHRFMTFLALLLVLGACGSEGGGGGGGSVDDSDNINRTFYQSNGICHRASTNERVSSDNCDGLEFYLEDRRCRRQSDDREVNLSNCTSNPFFLSDSICYDRAGNPVDNRRCIAGATNSNGREQVCSGPHLQFLENDILEGDCDGVRNTGNCSGARLFDLEAQRWVVCL